MTINPEYDEKICRSTIANYSPGADTKTDSNAETVYMPKREKRKQLRGTCTLGDGTTITYEELRKIVHPEKEKKETRLEKLATI